MSKHLSFKEHLFITEARQQGVKYSEKQVKGVVDKVTATLAGSDAANMSKLGKRYARLDISLKAMKEKHAELNQRLKGEMQDLFEAEDIVLTRVVETAQVTLTLSKEIQKTEKSKEIDYMSIIAALTALIPDELQSKVDSITERYTKLIDAKPPVARLQVTKANVSEGIIDTLKTWGAKFLAAMQSWGGRYDSKLDAIKRRAGLV